MIFPDHKKSLPLPSHRYIQYRYESNAKLYAVGKEGITNILSAVVLIFVNAHGERLSSLHRRRRSFAAAPPAIPTQPRCCAVAVPPSVHRPGPRLRAAYLIPEDPLRPCPRYHQHRAIAAPLRATLPCYPATAMAWPRWYRGRVHAAP